jgi:hypothetical protein
MEGPVLRSSFRSDSFTNMATTGNSCFWLVDFLKSSPQKPLGQTNWNLVGSIYGRSSIKIANFVPIRLQTWPSQQILVPDWFISKKIFSSEMWPNQPKFGRKQKFAQNRMKGEWHRLSPLSLLLQFKQPIISFDFFCKMYTTFF